MFDTFLNTALFLVLPKVCAGLQGLQGLQGLRGCYKKKKVCLVFVLVENLYLFEIKTSGVFLLYKILIFRV